MKGKNDASSINDDFDTPPLLTCQLTFELYLEPIMVFPSCQIYEMEYIQMHVEKKPHALCPITNIPIKAYAHAIEIKSQVGDYLENTKQFNQQYKRQKTHQDYKNFKIQYISCVKPTETEAALRQIFNKNDLNNERVIQSLTLCRIQILSPANIELTHSEQIMHNKLLVDVQNLIYALNFETPSTLNTETSSWKKIYIQEDGPKTQAMYATLKTAFEALLEMNPNILHEAKVKYAGQYDLVQTWLGGKQSIGSSMYGFFSKSIGTVSYQPGYLVSDLLNQVEIFLQTLSAVTIPVYNYV